MSDERTQALDAARAALRAAIAGLEAAAEALSDEFLRAVDQIANLDGRLAVMGVGKSGHVARKIAATLASTGQPAFFLHPTEASHGDLGQLRAGDGVLALSKSGETRELADVLGYARRFGLPVIAMTATDASLLAKAADVVLRLPDAPEACAEIDAPTTSTTVMMALGDALAAALLDRRGFTPEDFRVFHPGGALGARLLTVGDLMHAGAAAPLIGADARMDEALLVMTEKRLGCVGVVAQDRLVGVITDGDLRRRMGAELLQTPVRSVMTANPHTIAANALAGEALKRMNDAQITVLFVLDADASPIGALHIHDCLRAGVA
ncbi:MAG: SIS domain-containing protein [Maricaulaceae bacterium]